MHASSVLCAQSSLVKAYGSIKIRKSSHAKHSQIQQKWNSSSGPSLKLYNFAINLSSIVVQLRWQLR